MTMPRADPWGIGTRTPPFSGGSRYSGKGSVGSPGEDRPQNCFGGDFEGAVVSRGLKAEGTPHVDRAPESI